MNPDQTVLTPDERAEFETSALVLHPLEEQFADSEHAHEVASLGMWVFLVTELLLFGTLFLGVAVYYVKYQEAFEVASASLNWAIGGLNTIVLLVSSLFMVLAVHEAKSGRRERLMLFLFLTALLGVLFLVLKGYEYYTDYVENLIPGWRFVPDDWVNKGLGRDEVPHVQLFLLFYWIMTALHGIHVTIGIGAVLTMMVLAKRRTFSPAYYTPVDVTGLYWHFVDTVWIFLLPMLYLLGTHTRADLHF